MMWPPIILTTVFIYYAGAVTKDECLDFTVSDCYVDPSLIIWENDQVGTASLCQFACHNFPSCKEFRFYQDNCQLFSDNYKTSCDIIGGRADKSLEDCTGSVTVGGCDAFIEEECEYLGEDSGFSAPPGEFTSPVECEGYCKGFQVLGAEYWVWGKVNKTCDLLRSSKRRCLGISGPRDPPIEECQTPTTTTMPTTTPMPTTTTKPTTTPIPTTAPCPLQHLCLPPQPSLLLHPFLPPRPCLPPHPGLLQHLFLDVHLDGQDMKIAVLNLLKLLTIGQGPSITVRETEEIWLQFGAEKKMNL